MASKVQQVEEEVRQDKVFYNFFKKYPEYALMANENLLRSKLDELILEVNPTNLNIAFLTIKSQLARKVKEPSPLTPAQEAARRFEESENERKSNLRIVGEGDLNNISGGERELIAGSREQRLAGVVLPPEFTRKVLVSREFTSAQMAELKEKYSMKAVVDRIEGKS
jgi:hypothetical protein